MYTKRTWKYIILFCLPSLLGTILLYVIPYGTVLQYALSAGMDNLRLVAENQAFRTALKNTGILITAIPVSIALGLMTIWLKIESFRMKLLLICPACIPSAAVALIWKQLFPIESWVKTDWATAIFIVIFIWKTLGINAVLTSSARRRIPQDLKEAAKLDGASMAQCFFKIELPHMVHQIYFLFLLNLLLFWRMFREIYLITGDYPYDGAYYLQHFLTHAFHNFNNSLLSAASLMVTMLIIAVVGMLFALASRRGKDIHR